MSMFSPGVIALPATAFLCAYIERKRSGLLTYRVRYSKISSQLRVAGRKDLPACKALAAICPPAGSETPWTARHNAGAEGQIRGYAVLIVADIEGLMFGTGRGCYRD